MPRYAWVLEVRPGYEEEYEKRHTEIWPELVAEIRKAGQRNYAIFRYGLTLFGTFECDDIEQVFNVMKNSEVMVRWGKFNAGIMKADSDPQTGYPYLLPKVWDFAG